MAAAAFMPTERRTVLPWGEDLRRLHRDPSGAGEPIEDTGPAVGEPSREGARVTAGLAFPQDESYYAGIENVPW